MATNNNTTSTARKGNNTRKVPQDHLKKENNNMNKTTNTIFWEDGYHEFTSKVCTDKHTKYYLKQRHAITAYVATIQGKPAYFPASPTQTLYKVKNNQLTPTMEYHTNRPITSPDADQLILKTEQGEYILLKLSTEIHISRNNNEYCPNEAAFFKLCRQAQINRTKYTNLQVLNYLVKHKIPVNLEAHIVLYEYPTNTVAYTNYIIINPPAAPEPEFTLD